MKGPCSILSAEGMQIIGSLCKLLKLRVEGKFAVVAGEKVAGEK